MLKSNMHTLNKRNDLSDIEYIYHYYKEYMRQRTDSNTLAPPLKTLDLNIPTVTAVDHTTYYTLARKLSVLSGTFCIQSDPKATLNEYPLYNTQVEDNLLGYLDYTYVIRCENLTSLRKWLVEADAMISSERLQFFPELIEICHGNDYDRRHNIFMNDVKSTRFRVSPSVPAWIDVEKYLPLFQLELPVIDEMDLATLNKILNDYPEEAGAFRSYLSSALSALPSAIGSEQSSKAIQKIQSEIREGARIANIEYRKLRTVSGLKVGASVAATWSFVLYALFYEPPNLLKAIGPGGAITLVAKEVADYFQGRYDFKKNTFAFFALAKSARR